MHTCPDCERRLPDEARYCSFHYADHHFYAQGQQWVPESELVAANKEIERLRAHVKDAEAVLELGKAWWLARGHSRAVAEAAFGEAVGSYDPAAYQREES